MKIEFIIYSHFFKERGMKVKGDWNFPHLPRIGEEISPHIIMFQNEFTYQNLLEYLTDEAKSDFNKFNDGEDDLEGNFIKEWYSNHSVCEYLYGSKRKGNLRRDILSNNRKGKLGFTKKGSIWSYYSPNERRAY